MDILITHIYKKCFDLVEIIDTDGAEPYKCYKIQSALTNCISIENNVIINTCSNYTPTDGKYKIRLRKNLQIGTDRLTINKDSEDLSIINITGVAS